RTAGAGTGGGAGVRSGADGLADAGDGWARSHAAVETALAGDTAGSGGGADGECDGRRSRGVPGGGDVGLFDEASADGCAGGSSGALECAGGSRGIGKWRKL